MPKQGNESLVSENREKKIENRELRIEKKHEGVEHISYEYN